MLIHIYRIYTCIRGIHPYKQCIYKPFGIAAARLSDLTAIIIVGSFDSGRVSSPLVWVLGYKSGFWTFTNWRSRVASSVVFAERRSQSFHRLRHCLAHLRSVHVLSIAHVLVVIEREGVVLLLLLETLRLCISVGLAVVALVHRLCFLAVVQLVLNRVHVVFIVLYLLVILDRHALLAF